MSNKETITEIGKHYLPLNSLLKGSYAYSHSIFFRAEPPYKKLIPHLPAFYESPTNPGKFNQVPGYAVTAFAGYINFNGAGKLTGSGVSNRGGVAIDNSPFSFTGDYSVEVDWSNGIAVYFGKFKTASVDTIINHFFVMADNWKELKFIMLDSLDNTGKPLRQPVTSGVMTRIH